MRVEPAHDVFQCRHVAEQLRDLEGSRHALTHAARCGPTPDRLASQSYTAAVAADVAGYDVEQRRFASAIGADQCINAPVEEIEADVRHRGNGIVTLADIGEGENCRFVHETAALR